MYIKKFLETRETFPTEISSAHLYLLGIRTWRANLVVLKMRRSFSDLRTVNPKEVV